MKAIWKDQILAESNDTVVVEGNHYFPKSSLKTEFFEESTSHTTCPWKGVASYYTIKVDGEKMRMLPGTTPLLPIWPKALKITLLFGKASKS